MSHSETITKFQGDSVKTWCGGSSINLWRVKPVWDKSFLTLTVAVGSTETLNVCGEESSGLNQVIQTKLSSVKQEPCSYGSVR